MSEFPLHALTGVGIGLRHKHLKEIAETKPDVGWLEIHTENYFYFDSPENRLLDVIRESYPISAHSVGLSLGSYEGVDEQHIAKIKRFIDRYQPTLVSDHISWSKTGNAHLNDLLPLPYTDESLDVLSRNVDAVQKAFGRTILVENPSSYILPESTMTEWAFIAKLLERTGCGLLLDVNNIYVSAENHSFKVDDYLHGFPFHSVGEIHVAGHTSEVVDDEVVLIDNHGSRVEDEVWEIYDRVLKQAGQVPTLVEWDTNVPELSVLMEEKAKAEQYYNHRENKAAAAG